MKDWFLSSGDWPADPQLYVREIGKGTEPIIILHGGWGGEHSGLVDAFDFLTDDYRLIFYDQRGSLRSPFPDSLITFENHIKDVERLRKELKIDKVNIIAHSMGSVLASAYAEKFPDHIKNLIVLAPAQLKNPLPKDDEAIFRDGQERLSKFLERNEVSQELEKYNLTNGLELNSKQQTALFRIGFAKRMLYDVSKWPELTGGRAIYQGHVFGLTAVTYPEEGWDYIECLNRADHPTTIIVGDHDFLDMGNGLMKEWIKPEMKIDLRILEKAGHILWIDQPQIFEQEILLGLKK